MSHSQHALRRQIDPSREIYIHDVGCVYAMMLEALDLLGKTWYQPPRWDHEPTPEELEEEKKYQEECEEAVVDLEHVAGDIFEALTGRRVTGSKKRVGTVPSIQERFAELEREFGANSDASEDDYNPKLGIGQERDLLED